MDEAEVIYLEVDAEITEAIDKLKHTKSDAVKLVVPARSSLLQSAVNLKLLKKAAKDHSKEMAIVTNDKTAKYLAGGVGLAVASSLKAEPRVPEAVKEELDPDIIEPEPDEGRPTKSGDSSSKVAASGSKEKEGKTKSSEAAESALISKRAIGDDQELGEAAMGADELAQKKPKAKVPNYSAFQKKLLAGVGVLAAVLVVAVLFITLPTAKLTVIARADKLAINSPFVLDAASTQSDPSSLTYAAQKVTLQKDLTQNFNATGKKDVGTKATGTVTLSNGASPSPVSLPAGTILTSQGKTFSLDKATTVPAPTLGGPPIQIIPGKIQATITATQNGDSYNLGTTSFTVTGGVTATGATAGGTSKTVTVVTQADVDGAKQQTVDAAANASKDELLAKVDKEDVVFEDTLATTVNSVSSSAPVDSEAANGTVTVKLTYSVFTATKDTMNSLLDTLAKDAMPKGDQQLYQNGIEDAIYSLVKTISDTRVQLNVATSAYYGQKIDKQQIAKDTARKSKKSVTAIVQQDNPSVEKTLVESSLSLVPNMPALSSNITVIIKVSTD